MVAGGGEGSGTLERPRGRKPCFPGCSHEPQARLWLRAAPIVTESSVVLAPEPWEPQVSYTLSPVPETPRG